MRRLVSKAVKELKIGFRESLRITGIRDDTDDPDYTTRVTVLDGIEAQLTNLLQRLTTYSTDIQNAALESDSAYNLLKDVEAPPGVVVALTVAHVQEQLSVRCLVPLTEFTSRIRALRRVQWKRIRNRDLLASLEGPEKEARETKYLRYHTAFVMGVDWIAEKAPRIFQQSLAQEQFCLREYGKALKQNLTQTQPVVAAPPADPEIEEMHDIPPIEPVQPQPEPEVMADDELVQ
jgi:hypothetical protein